MRRILFMLFITVTVLVQAQTQTTVHIYLKNGGHLVYDTSDIDYMEFVTAEKGSQTMPYSVPELLEACNNLGADAYLNDGATVYTRGIVNRIKEISTQYGNASYYISGNAMGGTSLYVYRGKLLNGARLTTGNELHVGDTVVVCGKVQNFKGSTLEYASDNYLVEHHPFNPFPSAAKMEAALRRLEFPKSHDGEKDIIVLHECRLNDATGETGINYSVEWDNGIRAQRWSCYQLYASLLQRNTTRTSSTYPNDFFLPDYCQFSTDPYRGNGYDHGHICPSADRLCSEEANMQTFFMSNMQPQTRSFNSGIWSRMEAQVRTWAESTAFDTLYICKGGTIDKENQILKYISNDTETIPVPKYYFMALLGKGTQGYSAIGFWVEHKDGISSKDPLSNYMVNIHDLEQMTGIDFFHNLPDNLEESIEIIPVSTLQYKWLCN